MIKYISLRLSTLIFSTHRYFYLSFFILKNLFYLSATIYQRSLKKLIVFSNVILLPCKLPPLTKVSIQQDLNKKPGEKSMYLCLKCRNCLSIVTFFLSGSLANKSRHWNQLCRNFFFSSTLILTPNFSFFIGFTTWHSNLINTWPSAPSNKASLPNLSLHSTLSSSDLVLYHLASIKSHSVDWKALYWQLFLFTIQPISPN